MSEQCRTFRNLIPYFHDGTCPADLLDTVENHIRTCDECRKEYLRLGGDDSILDKRNIGARQERGRTPRHTPGKVAVTILGVIVYAAAAIGFFYGLDYVLKLTGGNPDATSYHSVYPSPQSVGTTSWRNLLIFIVFFLVSAVVIIGLWQLLKRIYKKLFPIQGPVFEMYTVKAGDTLWSIAEKQYGDGEKASLLKLLNGNLEQAVTGQKLRVRLIENQ